MKSEYNDIPKESLNSSEMKDVKDVKESKDVNGKNNYSKLSKFNSNCNQKVNGNLLNSFSENGEKPKDIIPTNKKVKKSVNNDISIIDSRKLSTENLHDMRITMTNILFVIGFNKKFISKSREELEGENYFGHYGKVLKLVINEFPYDKSNKNGPFYSIHINYQDEKETSHAILALHDKLIDKNKIKASYGTTKFCKNFIEKKTCFNKECLFYHKIDNSLMMNKVRIL